MAFLPRLTPYHSKNKMKHIALAGVAQWIEHQPVNQRIAGLIPSQGTCLGSRPGPQLGVCKRQAHIDVSRPLLLPPFPSKNKINKIFFKKGKIDSFAYANTKQSVC